MNSRNLILARCLAILAFGLSVQSSFGKSFGNFTYKDNGDSIEITGHPPIGYVEIIIPESIKGKPVTSIGKSAFRYKGYLRRVSIPDSVISIGDFAFADCDDLKSVEIPDNVSSIGLSAFSDCESLRTIAVGAMNPNFSAVDGVLYNHDKTKLIQYPNGAAAQDFTIPNGTTTIGASAFNHSKNLTNVSIPESVTSIEEMAFSNCIQIVAITVDGMNAHYKSINGALYDYGLSTLIQYPSGLKDKTYTIPNSVTAIGAGAFSGCSSLASVAIPVGVTSIGRYSFYGCNGLTDITIPDGVTHLGSHVFTECGGLSSITIPHGITSIGDYAFALCYGLDEVSIPNSVTSIGVSAFEGCGSLIDVSIPGSVTSIGSLAFYECYNLSNVTIYNGVTSIGSSAFFLCDSMDSITIPESVISIGGGAFYGCAIPGGVIFQGDAPTIGEDIFNVQREAENNYPSVLRGRVYYLKGKSGFKTTSWLRYRTEELGPAPEISVSQYDYNSWGYPPTIRIAHRKSRLRFGSARVGASGERIRLTIQNYGLKPLNISDISIVNTSPNSKDFSLVSKLEKRSLKPTDLADFMIQFKPKGAGARRASVLIRSNDPGRKSFLIKLVGRGISR
jgi:hypothetical protein